MAAMMHGARDKTRMIQAVPQSKSGYVVETCERTTTLKAEVLFGDSQVLFIEFQGEQYRLSKTRNGKLILTK
jgi:hemin uptake protein HemP